MAVAFVGIVGLVVVDRVSGRAGLALAALLLALGPLAAVWDWRTGNMTPWAVPSSSAISVLMKPWQAFSSKIGRASCRERV